MRNLTKRTDCFGNRIIYKKPYKQGTYILYDAVERKQTTQARLYKLLKEGQSFRVMYKKDGKLIEVTEDTVRKIFSKHHSLDIDFMRNHLYNPSETRVDKQLRGAQLPIGVLNEK